MSNLNRMGFMSLAIASISLGVALPLYSAATAQEQITLRFANTGLAESTTREGIKKVVADFEAKNPNIKIEMEAISFSEIARQMVLRVRSGNPPDIAELSGNDTVLLALTGGLEPLDNYIPPALMSNITPGALEGLRLDGKLIAVPWNTGPAGLWYNKKLLAAAGIDANTPPQTIDDLMVALNAIKEKLPDVIPLGIDTTNRPFALTANWPWMRTFGAKPVGEGATGAESQEMKAYLSWMRELAEKHFIDPGRKIGEFRPLAAQDAVAFIWDQILLQGVIQGANGMSDKEFYDTWGVAPMPATASGKPSTFEGGQQLVIFSGSKNKEAAWKFAEYLITDPVVIRDYTVKVNVSLPPLVDTGDPQLEAALDTPVFNAFADEITPTLTPQPYGLDYAGAATAIMAGVQEAVTGSRPIDEIAASIQKQLNRL